MASCKTRVVSLAIFKSAITHTKGAINAQIALPLANGIAVFATDYNIINRKTTLKGTGSGFFVASFEKTLNNNLF